MEKIEYICDQCGRTEEIIADWLEISSGSKDLAFKNYLPGCKERTSSKLKSIHFCSKKCVKEFFFLKEVKFIHDLEPTEEQVAKACLSFRHDFGIMPSLEAEKITFQAREWLSIWQSILNNAE